MIRYGKQWICTVLCVLLLIGSAGCRTDDPDRIETVPDGSGAIGEDVITADRGADEEDLILAYPTPQQKPTQEPGATPFPTRAPIEGDVSTGTFPDYDTGYDADWSYQSDELRVAIKRYENPEDQIVFYVADLWIRNISSFRMGFGNGKFNSGREDPEDFAAREHAIFAVSGTMNSGLVVHNGVKYKNVEKSDIAFRSGIVVIYRDGSVKMFNRAKKQSFSYDTENKQNGGVLHAFQFGPILLQNGEIPSGLKKNERHPRIIFGYCEPGHYVMVAVDGRTTKSIGMTEQEMAELMQSLGCTDAMNLDGGNSAVMLFMGKTINTPSGKDRDGDGVAGRNVVDLLAFAEYDADGSAPDLSSVRADKNRGE